jgi:hypothetical protein
MKMSKFARFLFYIANLEQKFEIILDNQAF